MRRIIAFGLILLLLFSAIGFAEEADFSTQSYQDMIASLDYESLLALSSAVNIELASRPEAVPLVLTDGMYLVGSDIAPGTYYFTSPDPAQYGEVMIYTNRITFENRYTQSGEGLIFRFNVSTPDTKRIILESGNLINVGYSIVLCSDKESAENYFTYTPPEGTYVPAGIYTVGTDILEGIYRFYTATGYEAEVEIYERGKRIERLEFYSDYETYRLLENYEIKVNDDIIMIRQPSLSFE